MTNVNTHKNTNKEKQSWLERRKDRKGRKLADLAIKREMESTVAATPAGQFLLNAHNAIGIALRHKSHDPEIYSFAIDPQELSETSRHADNQYRTTPVPIDGRSIGLGADALVGFVATLGDNTSHGDTQLLGDERDQLYLVAYDTVNKTGTVDKLITKDSIGQLSDGQLEAFAGVAAMIRDAEHHAHRVSTGPVD